MHRPPGFSRDRLHAHPRDRGNGKEQRVPRSCGPTQNQHHNPERSTLNYSSGYEGHLSSSNNHGSQPHRVRDSYLYVYSHSVIGDEQKINERLLISWVTWCCFLSQYGGPHQQQRSTGRPPQTQGEKWTHSAQSRSFQGPSLKRPVPPHNLSQPLREPSPSRDDCPSKRSRSINSHQVSHVLFFANTSICL